MNGDRLVADALAENGTAGTAGAHVGEVVP
jgi:hypothetical protein